MVHTDETNPVNVDPKDLCDRPPRTALCLCYLPGASVVSCRLHSLLKPFLRSLKVEGALGVATARVAARTNF